MIFLILCFISFASAVDLCDENVFNWRFYLTFNKGLMRDGIMDFFHACNHWKMKGANYGLKAHTVFGSIQYCKKYPDVKAKGACVNGSFSKAVIHYLEIGLKEGRKINVINYEENSLALVNKFMSILVSKKHGYALSSILFNNVTEVVNSYDRSMSFQYIINIGSEYGSLHEAGSLEDGLTDSTSTKIMQVTGYDGRYVRTITKPSYWKTGARSQLEIVKRIELDRVNQKLFTFEVSFKLPMYLSTILIQSPNISLTPTFNRAFILNLQSNSYTPFILKEGEIYRSNNPLMLANSENVAIGILLIPIKGLLEGEIKYECRGAINGPELMKKMTRLSVSYGTEKFVESGTQIWTKTYVAIGTTREVLNSLYKFRT